MDITNLSQQDIQMANEWSGYLSFKPNFIKEVLSKIKNEIVFVLKGNQGGGTATVVKDYCDRILGLHPIECKNMRPNTPVRTIRFGSKLLPTDYTDDEASRNTVYPAFKKFFPPYLIKKDITTKRPTMTIKDWQGGKDIYIEFVSYGQETDTQGGVQRFSVFLDEEPPKSFYEEQFPRLMAQQSWGGFSDLILNLTPTEQMSWTFDDVYNNADVIYNSPAIIQYTKKKKGTVIPVIEKIGNRSGIAVIRAASDDNPTFSIESIESKLGHFDDETTMENRRYGVYYQLSGVIFQEFLPMVHVISSEKYFPKGIPHHWLNSRGIDFHEHTNWACGWMSLSDTNEAFIWQEYNPSPDTMVTLQIMREIATRSKDYTYRVNRVDPLAAKNQTNTGKSSVDDMNRIMRELKMEGTGTGGYWETWDTKSLRGRDIVRQRLKNSRLVGTPFNNTQIDKFGVKTYLPTLWILDYCPITIRSFRNWKWDVWASKDQLVTKEEKNKPQDRYSHFPITYECIFKESAFNYRNHGSVMLHRESPWSKYMQARGA